MSKAIARPQSVHSQSAHAKSNTPKPVVPTAAELRAFFFLLRELGWKPGDAHPCGPKRNDPPPKGTKQPTKAMIEAVHAWALEMGWRMLNADEQNLIRNLRETTYKGRNHVYETAEAMRCHRPWIRGSSYNTEE